MKPLRGEIWDIDFSPTRGREQRGIRPSLVLSADRFNQGGAEMVIVLPLTSTLRAIPLHVRVSPPEGGLDNDSDIMCEQVRSVSLERCLRRRGRVEASTMEQVAERVRRLLQL